MRFELPPGYTVHVSHFRRYEKLTGWTYISDIPDHPTDALLPTGGITLAEITDSSENVIVSDMSSCSKLDNYNKKIGRNIATGRALKALDLLRKESLAELRFSI